MTFTLKVSNYKVGRTLGQGAYGKVKMAINETIGEPVAFKILNKHKIRKQGMQEKVKREVKAMKKLQHPHIVCLYQVIDTSSDIFLALELASGGDLYDRICSYGKLSETESKRLFRQLAAALVFSHSKGVAHRDLKLENLLFDANQNLKVADFGLCNMMQDGQSLLTACGSPDYAAPEILEHAAYDGTKVDAWSCGVILYTMMYGQLPFDGANQSLMFQKVVAGDFHFKDDVVEISDAAKDLIRKLLDPNPCSRYSMKQAQEHLWLFEASNEAKSSSYLVDYNRFLVTQGIKLKPRDANEVDSDLCRQLAEISQQFPFQKVNLPYEHIIGKYFRTYHRSSLKKELGKDAYSVQNLCVAYKFLLYRRVVALSIDNEVQRQAKVTQFQQTQSQFQQPATQKIVSLKQLDRLALLRQRLTGPGPAKPTPATASEATEAHRKDFKLLFRVDGDSTDVQALIELVCKALLDMGYTWQFATGGGAQKQLDGRVMIAAAPSGESFLIFFHKAVERESGASRAYYAVDFGVKNHSKVCHLNHFGAIADAYEAIVSRVDSRGYTSGCLLDKTQTIIRLKDASQMQAELISMQRAMCEEASSTVQDAKTNKVAPRAMSAQGTVLGKDQGEAEEPKHKAKNSDQIMTSYETIDTKETLTDQPLSFETNAKLV